MPHQGLSWTASTAYQQMMEKFFKPVHSPSGPDEIKLRRHHHHHPLHHHQDPQSHRYTMFDDTNRNTDESHGHHHHHQHGHYLQDSPHHNAHHRHQTQQFHQSEDDEILYNHETHVTLSRASSSSLSSSSSSSFSSWNTEASANDPFSIRHAEQPLHSLSCSNITDVRRGFRDDDSSEPIVFASIKHGKTGSVCSESHGSSHRRGKHGFSTLDRGHSRSDEGLLQGNESDLGGEQSRVQHMNYGPLYKTASLNRSLAFSEEDILLGVSRGPKRAVSSSQLPGKGILKNKEPHSDIRKAKSMEVLSPRVSKGQDPSGQKGKGITQVEMEQARNNFVQGKLQFSAFLDEITQQVISPSALTILGVNKNKITGKTPAPTRTPGPVKPQLPPKKHRESSGEEKEQHPKQRNSQEKAAHSSSRKHSDCSNSEKLNSYAAKNHHGSSPPHHYAHSQGQNTHQGSSRKDRRPSPTGSSVSEDRYGRCGPHLTDGTSTSPEPSQPKQRHHRKQQPVASHSQHTQHFPQDQPQQAHPGLVHRGPASSPPSSAQGVGPGLGSESSSTKSDSPRARDTASTATSYSSEQSGRHHSQHVGHSKQRRDTLCDADHLQALQEENADLHQNLLQTVVCIESLEAELQRTRDELSHVKEKYKSLLETHTGTKQANNLLGEHLHIALSSELEDAHRTMAALENINVPCLIKELLEKHFDSTEAIQKSLTTSVPIIHSAPSSQADGQSHAPKVEEAAHDWLTKSEAGPQRVTAFMPFKQGVQTTGTEDGLSGQHRSSHSPPFSVADISTAIYKKMAASYAARPQPLYPQSQPQPPLGTNHADTPQNLQQAHVGGDSWGGKGAVKVTLLEQDVVDVTSMSAQQILDEFIQQLQTHKEAGGGKEQQGGQEWAGGAEQTGKVAD
ncbi:repetin [Enoplosus armatus]|uniref:repetin n=1 Tax=Enoplosus armatus TaxID=215367 RepID=UPI0039965B21